jgi:osmotically-inducible protein OsmY
MVCRLQLVKKAFCTALIVAVAVWAAAFSARAQNEPAARKQGEEEKRAEGLAREVRHQLAVLPYVSVFDHITFTMDGNNVKLTGQVVRHTLKTAAEAAVKSIEGVGSVVNAIEELPASASDDDLRRAVYRAIYEDAALSRYATVELPAIHIIVKNGNVALEGEVDSEADRNRALVRAGFVANVAGVKNNLVVRAKENGKE